jgi:hypothetical protein
MATSRTQRALLAEQFGDAEQRTADHVVDEVAAMISEMVLCFLAELLQQPGQ